MFRKRLLLLAFFTRKDVFNGLGVFFFRIIVGFADGIHLCQLLWRQIAVHADQRVNSLHYVRPGNSNIRAFSFSQPQSFRVVIHPAVTGNTVTVTANSEFVFQELGLLFRSMCRFCRKEVIDTGFATDDAAGAVRQSGVDFVFGDKRSMWQFCGGLRDNGLREGKRLKAGAKTIHAAMPETQETLVCVFILGLGIIPRYIVLKIDQIARDSVNFFRH